jgi:hypothetical protein
MNLNLKYSNAAVICIFQIVSADFNPADTIDPSLVVVGLS